MNEDHFHLGIKAIIRNKSGKVLLLEINPASLKNYTGPTYWDIPGGRIQLGDTVEDTLIREVFEETGISDLHTLEPLVMILSNIRITPEVGLILWVYLCETSTTKDIRLSNEHLNSRWFTPTEAASLLDVKYPKQATEAIRALVPF